MVAVQDYGLEQVDQPLHSSDLATSHYDLFPNMKKHLVVGWQDECFFTNGIQAVQHQRKCEDCKVGVGVGGGTVLENKPHLVTLHILVRYLWTFKVDFPNDY